MRRKKKSKTSRRFSRFLALMCCGLRKKNDDEEDGDDNNGSDGNSDDNENDDNSDGDGGDDNDEVENSDNVDSVDGNAEGFSDDDDSFDELSYDDIDDDDVFVTREYVSESATNIVKQHDIKEQARSQSAQGFGVYVNRKIKEMPKKKKWYKSSFENIQSTAEDRIERMLEICNEIVVEPHAMFGFFADGLIEVVPEIDPSNHFVDHGGDGPDIEMYIE
ncbi:hypothetical protein ACF0H5_013846 [Mactra antiquata]